MKNVKNINRSNFFKKVFIKICRMFDFEIIDQANFSSPTLNKNLDQTLSTQGSKSITLPMGQVDIKRKISSIKIIIRTCTSELIMDQNKRRLFDCEKNEYTFRTLKSLIRSINKAKAVFNNINFDILVTDTNSSKEDIVKIKEILKSSNIPLFFFKYPTNRTLPSLNLRCWSNFGSGIKSDLKPLGRTVVLQLLWIL